MKYTFKIIIFILISFQSYSQSDTLSVLCEVSKWRYDYHSLLPITSKETTDLYVIPKHVMNKNHTKATVSYEDGTLYYLAFDSCRSHILNYYCNFIELYDERRAIAYHKVVDSLVLSSKANFTLTRVDSRLFLLLTNYQDVLGGSQTDKHLIEEIIYISHETLILLDKDGYLSVYTNDHIPRGKSSLEKDDYFLVNVLTNYFKSKNLLYKVEDNEIIRKSLEEIHGKN